MTPQIERIEWTCCSSTNTICVVILAGDNSYARAGWGRELDAFEAHFKLPRPRPHTKKKGRLLETQFKYAVPASVQEAKLRDFLDKTADGFYTVILGVTTLSSTTGEGHD